MTQKIIKGELACDPRGMIYEAYRIEGISEPECRDIFLDWALRAPDGDMQDYLEIFMRHYGQAHPDHPMTQVIKSGQQAHQSSKRRRGGRAGRQRG